MGNRSAQIGPLTCGERQPLLLIAGPCVIESEALTQAIAESLLKITSERAVSFVFKASFDKANRTSGKSFRGVGIQKGLEILRKISSSLKIPVTTDIHESHQAGEAAEVCALLQIPAFLCRQTDLLMAAAATKKAIHVKKGQFLAPSDMEHVVKKLREAGASNVLVCERGTFFGYGRLVNDMRSLVQMRSFGAPVIFDATHSVQEPGGLGAATGGSRDMVEPLARAAMAIGVDGVFLETHPRPDESPSDGPNMVPLDQLPKLLDRLLAIRSTVESFS